ncbi:hypothetical protein NXS08_00980 [Gleimia sp. 6138-11-ORH1]|uniref:DUF6912 family protein n=1 Tax=Gleimia sp. 6138-11-ORH1 TaxID=2973937 RepID=UPI002169C7F9|nr:hypothetical protein [Gleimia sp. 6138-11-ORH1]MCS4484066.1 hypothetical protein [Gleimia sp. 6138-11-ORH1]
MRVFIPATLVDLTAKQLPLTEAVLPQITETGPDAAEIADYEATEDASLLSLNRIRETPTAPPRRVVVAVEVKHLDEIQNGITWDKVAAFLVDGSEATPWVTAACTATTQEAADEAVAELLECALEWYAPEELELLRKLAVS